MGAVFLHQLRDHLKSLRFQLSFLLILLLFAANGAVYTWKHEQNLKDEATVFGETERILDEIEYFHQAASATHRPYMELLGTEFIAEGGAQWFNDIFIASPATDIYRTPFPGRARSQNNWMQRFEEIDWTLIVRLVLSFVCIALAYDAVSGELARGTLHLLLSFPLSRARLLAGKYLAYVAVVLCAVLLGCLVSLAILSLTGAVALSGGLLLDVLLFLGGTFFYCSLFVLLGMGVSALTRHSATALMLTVTTWTVLVVVIPQSSYTIAIQAEDTPQRWWEVDNELYEMHETLAGEGIAPRGREAGRVDDYAVEREYAARLREVEKRRFRLLQRNEQDAIKQYMVAWRLNLLSPAFAFQYSIEALLRTGVARYEDFLRQSWRHLDALREWLERRDAADPDSPHILFLRDYLSQQPINPDVIPRFQYRPLPATASLAWGAAPLAILLLETLLAFFFALWAFNRMDLTG